MKKIILFLLTVIVLMSCNSVYNKQKEKNILKEKIILINKPENSIDIKTKKSQNEKYDCRIEIDNSLMNFFYIGISNPIKIISNIKDSLIISIQDSLGTVKKDLYSMDRYSIYIPKYKNVTLEIARIRNNKKEILRLKKFRAKYLPEPVVNVCGKSGGEVSKELMLAQLGVRAYLENFDISLYYNVISFTVSTANSKGKIIEKTSNSSRFTPEQKEQISQLKKGQKVYFENIKIRRVDGSIKTLQPLMFRIK